MPHSWVADEGIWKRAKKKAALQGESSNYALIADIYQKMGGRKKAKKSMDFQYVIDEDLFKAGPFYGPKGGKYADARLTIPWKEGQNAKPKDEPYEGPLLKTPPPGWKKTVPRKNTGRGPKKTAFLDPSGQFRLTDTGPDVFGPRFLLEKKSGKSWSYVSDHKNVSSAVNAAKPKVGKSMIAIELLAKSGPFYGPKGGKYADAKLTIPWKESSKKDATQGAGSEDLKNAVSYAQGDYYNSKDTEKWLTAISRGEKVSVDSKQVASDLRYQVSQAKEYIRDPDYGPGLGAEEAIAAYEKLYDFLGRGGGVGKSNVKKSENPMSAIEEIELLAKSYGENKYMKTKKMKKMDMKKEMGEDGDEELDEEMPDDEGDVEKAFSEIMDIAKSMSQDQAYDSSPTIDKNKVKTEGHKHHQSGGVIPAPEIKSETLDPDGDPNGGHDKKMDSDATVVHHAGGHGDPLAQGPNTQANQSGFKSPSTTTDGKHDHFETGGSAGIKAPGVKPENITMGGDPNGGGDYAAPTSDLVVKAIMEHNLGILDHINPNAAAYVRMNHEMIEKSYGVMPGSSMSMSSSDPQDIMACVEKLKRILGKAEKGWDGVSLVQVAKALQGVKYMAKDHKMYAMDMGHEPHPGVVDVCEKLEMACKDAVSAMYKALM